MLTTLQGKLTSFGTISYRNAKWVSTTIFLLSSDCICIGSRWIQWVELVWLGLDHCRPILPSLNIEVERSWKSPWHLQMLSCYLEALLWIAVG